MTDELDPKSIGKIPEKSNTSDKEAKKDADANTTIADKEAKQERARPAGVRADIDSDELKKRNKAEIVSLKEDKKNLKEDNSWLKKQVEEKNDLLKQYISDQEELGRLKEKDNSKKHANTLCIALVGLFPALSGVALLLFGEKGGRPFALVFSGAAVIVSVFLYFHDTRK